MRLYKREKKKVNWEKLEESLKKFDEKLEVWRKKHNFSKVDITYLDSIARREGVEFELNDDFAKLVKSFKKRARETVAKIDREMMEET